MGLSVGQGVSTTTCLVSVHELNHVCSDQFSKDSERSNVLGTEHDADLLFT